MKLKIAIPAIIGVSGLGFLAFRRKSEASFQKEVNNLFAASPCISEKRYSAAQLEGLPEPVQRYFLACIKRRTIIP
ncbi:hypothetical protein [Adhaeribacter soli]|uniref:hypothetical protein n=1 Tax=Adhaeribacter soli TaxID=2607655 RepID=UPI00177FB17E|nr:hypothetical protein [Adhaeribacter soli]